jgi:hypothetical protein
MHRTIVSSRLTTCDVVKGGEATRLDLVNKAGHSVSIELSFEQAEAIVMTLPQLLSQALKSRAGSDHSRYVFPSSQWALESTTDVDCLILTMITTDGFETAVGIPFADCQQLGAALLPEGKAATETPASGDKLVFKWLQQSRDSPFYILSDIAAKSSRNGLWPLTLAPRRAEKQRLTFHSHENCAHAAFDCVQLHAHALEDDCERNAQQEDGFPHLEGSVQERIP